MLAEHDARRREALSTARRHLAEAAALKRRVADWARGHGHAQAAAQLEQEATGLDSTSAELVGLDADSRGPDQIGPGRSSSV